MYVRVCRGEQKTSEGSYIRCTTFSIKTSVYKEWSFIKCGLMSVDREQKDNMTKWGNKILSRTEVEITTKNGKEVSVYL